MQHDKPSLQQQPAEFFQNWIDTKVKKRSKTGRTPKPFKSTFLINTVKGITVNPNTNNPAFCFHEDESIVDCWQCEIVNS